MVSIEFASNIDKISSEADELYTACKTKYAVDERDRDFLDTLHIKLFKWIPEEVAAFEEVNLEYESINPELFVDTIERNKRAIQDVKASAGNLVLRISKTEGRLAEKSFDKANAVAAEHLNTHEAAYYDLAVMMAVLDGSQPNV